MPEFKKSRGFKMKGFSGFKGSPAKMYGKKSPAKQPVSGSDMTDDEADQFSIDQANKKFGEKGVEVKGNEETKTADTAADDATDNTPDTTTDDTDVAKAGGMDWAELGQGLAAQVGGALARKGVDALTRKREKTKKKGPDTTAFSGIKFGN